MDDGVKRMEEPSARKDSSKGWTLRPEIRVTLALALCWGLYDLAVFRVLELESFSNDFLRTMLAIGPCFGQVVLLALWAAWGPGTFIFRGAIALLLLLAQSMLVADTGELLMPLIPLGLGFATCGVLLLVMRGISGWSIQFAGSGTTQPSPTQYSMRQLLILTTLTAAVAAVAKVTTTYVEIPPQLMDVGRLATACVGVFLCTAPVIFLFMTLLAPDGIDWRRIALVLLLTLAATGAAILLGSVTSPRTFLDELEGIGGLVAGVHAGTFVSAVALRKAGYRVAPLHGIGRAGEGQVTS